LAGPNVLALVDQSAVLVVIITTGFITILENMDSCSRWFGTELFGSRKVDGSYDCYHPTTK
jgi:hypothetical protein